jgi:hypothetical protein
MWGIIWLGSSVYGLGGVFRVSALLLSAVVVGVCCDLLPGNCVVCLVIVVPFPSMMMLWFSVFAFNISLDLSLIVFVALLLLLLLTPLLRLLSQSLLWRSPPLGTSISSVPSVVELLSGRPRFVEPSSAMASCYLPRGLLHSTISQISCLHTAVNVQFSA